MDAYRTKPPNLSQLELQISEEVTVREDRLKATPKSHNDRNLFDTVYGEPRNRLQDSEEEPEPVESVNQ